MLHTDLISCAWYHAPAAPSEKPRSASAACRARPMVILFGDVKVVKAHEPYHLQIATVNPEDSLKIHKDKKKTYNLYQKIVGTICLFFGVFLCHILGFLPKEIGDATFYATRMVYEHVYASGGNTALACLTFFDMSHVHT